jgi:hypothetical protein
LSDTTLEDVFIKVANSAQEFHTLTWLDWYMMIVYKFSRYFHIYIFIDFFSEAMAYYCIVCRYGIRFWAYIILIVFFGIAGSLTSLGLYRDRPLII